MTAGSANATGASGDGAAAEHGNDGGHSNEGGHDAEAASEVQPTEAGVRVGFGVEPSDARPNEPVELSYKSATPRAGTP